MGNYFIAFARTELEKVEVRGRGFLGIGGEGCLLLSGFPPGIMDATQVYITRFASWVRLARNNATRQRRKYNRRRILVAFDRIRYICSPDKPRSFRLLCTNFVRYTLIFDFSVILILDRSKVGNFRNATRDCLLVDATWNWNVSRTIERMVLRREVPNNAAKFSCHLNDAIYTIQVSRFVNEAAFSR